MGSGLTDRDGVFTVRDQAWHGLADVFTDYPTREEAQPLVHGWEPLDEPVYKKVLVEGQGRCEACGDELFKVDNHWESGRMASTCYGNGPHVPTGETVEYEEVDGWVLRSRSDDNSELGVVSSTLAVVNNSEMWDIAEVLEDEAKGSVQFETGGSLDGGRKVWLLVRLREPIRIKNDPRGDVIPYFALQNDHVGTGSFRGQAVMDRIVCANTARAADMFAEEHDTEFVFRHTRKVAERIEEAKNALAGWRDSIESYRLMMDHFTNIAVTREQRTEFIERFFPYPMDRIATERVRANTTHARNVYTSFLVSETCQGTSHTAAGLLNASVEYLNYGRKAHTAETRFKRNMLTKQKLVSDAARLIREVARV